MPQIFQSENFWSFVQITDTHYGHLTNWNETCVRAVIDWVNDNMTEYNIDFVILTGDNTQSYKAEDIRPMIELRQIYLDNLKVFYWIIPGNHEHKFTLEDFALGWDLHFGNFTSFYEISKYYSFTHKGINFICIGMWGDDCYQDEGRGIQSNYIMTEEALNFLDQELNIGYPSIVVTHIPLAPIRPPIDHENYGYWNFVNNEEIYDVLKKHDTDVFIISGHRHIANHFVKNFSGTGASQKITRATGPYDQASLTLFKVFRDRIEFESFQIMLSPTPQLWGTSEPKNGTVEFNFG